MRNGIELGVVHAGEVDLRWGLDASDEQLRTVSYRGLGKDLLVETPYGPLTSNFETMLFGIAVRGYRILLAHPERNPTFQEDPERVERMSQTGTLLQVTAPRYCARRARRGRASSPGDWSRAGTLTCWHRTPTAPPRRIGAACRSGARVAAELVGGARAGWMVESVPRAILLGEPLPEAPPIESRRGGRLARLRER